MEKGVEDGETMKNYGGKKERRENIYIYIETLL